MLAHQGGWDEILLVLGPIAIIAGLLYLAKKRVKDNQSTPPSTGTATDADDSSDAV